MDNIQELIFSILGIAVYWFLSNLGKKKTNKNKSEHINENTIIPPENNKRYEEEEYEQEEVKQPVKAPKSFSDLLNILSDPSKLESRQKDINPLDPEKSELRLQSDLERYSRSQVSEDTYANEMDRYLDERGTYRWEDDFTDDDIDTIKVEKGRNIVKTKKPKPKPKKVTSLFKNPNRIRDAFIMNEVLTTKFND